MTLDHVLNDENFEPYVDLNLVEPPVIEAISKLDKDVKQAASTMTASQARYLVDLYYSTQRLRIATGNAKTALDKSAEPTEVLTFVCDQQAIMEKQVKTVLGQYSLYHPVGRWSRQVVGVGPVLAAGLLGYIDIEKAPHVGHIWSFAGLDPSKKWEKGKLRPWCARLKLICYLLGDSFMKTHNREHAVYGRLYKARKELEQARNEKGMFAEQAKLALATKDYGEETIARSWYEKGMLPPARIDMRARRYAVKMFLSHWHEVAHYVRYERAAPMPYAYAVQGHADVAIPPHLETLPNLVMALKDRGPVVDVDQLVRSLKAQAAAV